MRKILVVEDEPLLRETYEMILATQPYIIDTAENGRVALQKCGSNEYDLILLDLMMPILDGVGFMEEFMSAAPDRTRVVIMSNLSSGKELDAAMSLGAERNVLKAALSPQDLLSLVRYDLEAI